MSNNSKRTMPLVVAAALAALPLAGTAQTTNSASASNKVALAELFPDTVVARGKGVEIKRSQLDEALVSIKASQGRSLPPEQMAMFEQQILDQLVTLQLLLGKANDADKKAGKELATKRVANVKERAGTEENLVRQLKSVGLTVDRLSQKLTEEAIAETALMRELNVKVSDEDVKKFYDENPSQFEQAESVRASHILFAIKDPATGNDLSEEKKAEKLKQAKAVLERARKGEDFAKLAKEFSEDPGSKDNGGEYTFGRGRMVPEFESAAFALQTNQVSDVVTTQFGYHIIKLSEKIPAKKIALEDKVKEQVRDYLKKQALNKVAPDYLAKLKEESKLEILDERLKIKEDAMELPPGHPPIGAQPKEPAKADKAEKK